MRAVLIRIPCAGKANAEKKKVCSAWTGFLHRHKEGDIMNTGGWEGNKNKT